MSEGVEKRSNGWRLGRKLKPMRRGGLLWVTSLGLRLGQRVVDAREDARAATHLS